MEICCSCSASLGTNNHHHESLFRFKDAQKNEQLISPIHKKRESSFFKRSREPEGTVIIRSLPPPLIPIHDQPILPPLEPITDKVDSDRLQFFSDNPLLFQALNSSGKSKTFHKDLSSNFGNHHDGSPAAVSTSFQMASTGKSTLINQQLTHGHSSSFSLRPLTPIDVSTAGMTPSQPAESKNNTIPRLNCLVYSDSQKRCGIQACGGFCFRSVRQGRLDYRCKAGSGHRVIDKLIRHNQCKS